MPEQAVLDHVVMGQGGPQAYGGVASALLQNDFDPRALRPFVVNGQAYISRMVNNKLVTTPVSNANATLLRLEWTELDKQVIKAALPRLKAVADIRARGQVYTIADGMGTTILQSQAQSDVNGATISMDGLARSPGDRPVFNLGSLPLPIIHKDFSFSARQIATSRKGSVPLDFSMAESAARRVAEGAEQLLLGVATGYSYGGGSVYGYTNFPGRITKSLTLPTGTNAAVTITEVINMRQLSMNQFHYGPWTLYVSLNWGQFLDQDYLLTGGNVTTMTLRERLARVEGITNIITLDYLKGYDMVLVSNDSAVAREVIGMDITTVQWESEGGMQVNFKVMCIMVPQIRGDFNGNTGIVHGSVSGQTALPAGTIILPLGNP